MGQFEFDTKLSKCVSCDSSDLVDYVADFRKINICKCNNCGLQFMNPQYTDIYLAEYYSLYTNDEDLEYWHNALLYGHDFYLSLIESYISPGALLDIGCGNGHLLEAAINRGWDVTGYDVDEKSTKKVAKRLGVNVESSDFFEVFLNHKGIYDLVTMHQVLEHLKSPGAYLDKIYSLIKDGGYIFVAVPNIHSLSNRIKFFLEGKGLRKKNIGKYYDTNHHVLYFDPDTLTFLLRKHGFQVVYKRNGHKARPEQSKVKRFFMRNVTDFLFMKSTFFVVAKKVNEA